MTWNVADRELVSWLGTPETDVGWCGYQIDPRPDAVWLLHAMYERESGTTELTYDERWRQRLAAGLGPILDHLVRLGSLWNEGGGPDRVDRGAAVGAGPRSGASALVLTGARRSRR
ncbi:hypothetical protein ABZ942_36600 [Nocardia sp. NPDC046473]|uniref:hypothetical protein n=1 Tax=Nocardia sp. NPDC046473 TaxID=3155733 RepID=UPI003404FC6F